MLFSGGWHWGNLSFLIGLCVLNYFLNYNLLSVQSAQLNQEKEEVEQKKNEYNFKMRQLGHVMDFATEYPQVLFQKSAFQNNQFFKEKCVNRYSL